MNDPLRSFKIQPWKQLFITAFITIIIVSSIDAGLMLLIANSASLQKTVYSILSPPLGMLLPLAIAGGIGVLAVYICERFQPRLFLNTGSLWALVLCLIIALGVTGLLPFPSFLVNFSFPAILGMMVGVFWKGRNYWR
jgi:hypothetical protein